MPLFPIDLQTLFTQTAQVGKEQAAQKEASPLAQSLQGAAIARRTEQRDNTANETRDPEEGPEQVRDRARRGAERERRKAGRKKPAGDAAPERDVLRDPALGRNIDITS